LDVSAQWSGDPLYSDDQLVLGSVSTVRGFTNSAVRVDAGAIARAELAPAIPFEAALGEDFAEGLLFLSEALPNLEPYVFADYGAGRDIASGETLARAGIGAGIRYRHGRITLDASLGQPVYRAGGAKPRDWRMPEAYLTLSVKLL